MSDAAFDHAQALYDAAEPDWIDEDDEDEDEWGPDSAQQQLERGPR